MIKKISVITVFLLIFCFISCANAGNTGSDSSSGSENNSSEAEEVLNGDFNGTMTSGFKKMWVSLFILDKDSGYYEMYVYTSPQKKQSDLKGLLTAYGLPGVFYDDTKMESAHFSLTSNDGINYSGTIELFDEEFEITLRKKLH